MAGRNSSGDGEPKRSVKKSESRNSSTGFSPGRRSVLPKGMNTASAGKNPAKPKIRLSPGTRGKNIV